MVIYPNTIVVVALGGCYICTGIGVIFGLVSRDVYDQKISHGNAIFKQPFKQRDLVLCEFFLRIMINVSF